jgi:solute carrier family 50 (sugar transporter)
MRPPLYFIANHLEASTTGSPTVVWTMFLPVFGHHDADNWSLLIRLCGYLAPVFSILVGVSPYPTVRHIQRRGKVGDYPLLPYTSMVITSTLSLAYGLLRDNVIIWSTSAVAVVLGIYYLLCYVQYAHTVVSTSTLPGTVEQHVAAVCVAMMLTILWTLNPLGLASHEPDWLIGKVGLWFRVLMFASPLTTIRVVIRTRSARSIPLPFALASSVNCILWIIFGVCQVKDPNVYLPNVLGLGFALAQLTLKALFRSSDDASSPDESIHEALLSTDEES